MARVAGNVGCSTGVVRTVTRLAFGSVVPSDADVDAVHRCPFGDVGVGEVTRSAGNSRGSSGVVRAVTTLALDGTIALCLQVHSVEIQRGGCRPIDSVGEARMARSARFPAPAARVLRPVARLTFCGVV